MNLLLIEDEPLDGWPGPTTVAAGMGLAPLSSIEGRITIHMEYSPEFFRRVLAVGDEFTGWYFNFFS